MAALTVTNLLTGGAVATTVNTLTNSDTIQPRVGVQMRVVLTNTTGSSVTANFDGADAALIPIEGFGSVDPRPGLDIVVPGNSTRSINVATRSAYLTGLVTIAGGVGLTAIVLEG